MSATLKVPAWERAGIFAGLFITCWLWGPAVLLAWAICRGTKRTEVESFGAPDGN